MVKRLDIYKKIRELKDTTTNIDDLKEILTYLFEEVEDLKKYEKEEEGKIKLT